MYKEDTIAAVATPMAHVGDTMLSALGVVPAGNIGPGSMIVSLFQGLNHLIASDMLRIRKKPKGFF